MRKTRIVEEYEDTPVTFFLTPLCVDDEEAPIPNPSLVEHAFERIKLCSRGAKTDDAASRKKPKLKSASEVSDAEV